MSIGIMADRKKLRIQMRLTLVIFITCVSEELLTHNCPSLKGNSCSY